jgi:hypothetical protein
MAEAADGGASSSSGEDDVLEAMAGAGVAVVSGHCSRCVMALVVLVTAAPAHGLRGVPPLERHARACAACGHRCGSPSRWAAPAVDSSLWPPGTAAKRM